YGAGAALVMWLSEKINENGIGNGISMILFANIVSRLPSFALSVIRMVSGQGVFGENQTKIPIWLGIIIAVVAIVVAVAMIAFIVWMTNSERRIPIQYA
ncbi:MAG: preprotein translocase subunit SecY, partial [Clostridia bacterium]|nr:preprotein translocase subunit SecY [Clostridia bacterium]